MPLLDASGVAARRPLVARGGPLAGLYESLAAELEPLLEREVYVPSDKALLSRDGGRCADDGALLDFDPFAPWEHRCPACGRVWGGELHHRAWITWYQLWLAERAVHAAVFHALRGEERHRRLAADILGLLAERYLGYPNADNVLGPSRLFFSTYLESIWLLQITIAADLAADGALRDRVRERIAEPARAMIAQFDEGRSNRQVWNNAALLAAASLCGDSAAFERTLHGHSGLLAHLEGALLGDGSWYEGENYHQFALRGLWYAVALAEAAGSALPPRLIARYHHAFAVPFVTALPDFTMPSRKDSQYAVSLRQWRLAELTELGYARACDPVLRFALARCYEPGHPRRDTGRSRSAADAERNTPSGALTREDLGWRALLFALPQLPDAGSVAQRSALLPAQGYAVFRREPEVYVGFDYGQCGGGHGHPDRLNLTLYQSDTRWLDDLGTGSYVDPSLHWYRSTLAHNAPLVDGRSQPLADGVLLAHDEREGMGWTAARFEPDVGVRLERAVVVAPGYVVDCFDWTAEDGRRVELPLHLEGRTDVPWRASTLDGGEQLSDGFRFVRDARAVPLDAGQVVRVRGEHRGRRLAAHVVCSAPATMFVAAAPGQPSTVQREFFVVRSEGARTGTIRSVFAWDDDPAVTFTSDAVTVSYSTGETHVHRRGDSGWHVDLLAGSARSSIDLDGRAPPPQEAARSPDPAATTHELRADRPLRLPLGREHYRRSELSWADAGSPSAVVTLERTPPGLRVVAQISAGDLVFSPAGASNPFDNEHADTMAAGVQLYLRTNDAKGAWSLVPDEDGRVRVRAIHGDDIAPPTATWHGTARHAYEVRVELALPDAVLAGEAFALDLYINETTRGRTRRRGQLVLTGAEDEWVYLRGDRHDDRRWLHLRLA